MSDKGKEEWNKIIQIDDEMCFKYLDRLKKEKERASRPKKRKLLDDIQISLDCNNQILNNRNNKEQSIGNIFFDSPEAKKLFHPRSKEESVLKCLQRRERALFEATMDDIVLLHLIKDSNVIEEITVSAREIIRYKCLYLRKAYEIAVQKMNTITWGECCSQAVNELCNIGISFITYGRTIQRWNVEFCNKETFLEPNQQEKRQPTSDNQQKRI